MLAIDFSLIEDINTAGLPLEVGRPTNVTKVGEEVYFTTERISFATPESLWKIDATTQEAVLLKAFSTISGGILDTAGAVEFNGSFYFTANDGASGFELWKSDGTAEGTVLVKDTIAGAVGGMPTSLTNANGVLYFVVSENSTTPSRPIQLWKSDGTTAGTIAVASIGTGLGPLGGTIGVGDSYTEVTRNITAVGSDIYFVANGASGVELWRSDRTAVGTAAVADIRPGTLGSNPVQLTAVGDLLYFSANDGAHGHELWRTDGTVAGTSMVVDLNPGAGNGFFRELIVVNGTLFFRGNDGIEGSELWKSDGTAAGTVLVKSFSPDGFGGEPDMFYNWAGTLYFTARDYGGFGLWKTDGTMAGTNLLRSIADGGPYLDLPRDLDAGTPWVAVMGDELYFLGDFHNRLWKTDGTAAGTVPVRQLVDVVQPSVPMDEIETWMIAGGDRVYFVYSPYAGSGQSPRLMTSDGTSAGTLPISAADSGTDHAIISWSQQTVGGITYFAATDAAHGLELWRSDGTAAGTYLVRDVNTGVLGSGVHQLVVMDGILYFAAQDGTTRGLWRSDGTEAGTWQVKAYTSGPSWLTVVDDVLYFQSNAYNVGLELWRTDGTLEGTSLVKVVSPSSASSNASRMIAFDGELYFKANDGVSGQELWKSDGTAEGTVLLADIAPGIAGSNPANFNIAGDFLFFATGQLTRDLWRTDGTTAGTLKLSSSSSFSVLGEFESPGFQEAGGLLYFVGTGADGTGSELWRTDGSIAGTFRLADISPGANSSNLANFTNANGVLLFTNLDGSSQRQLWRSDGTVAGTTLATPILANAGTVVSLNGFRKAGDDSWFTVGNSSNEVEFWRTDGTAAGTIFVTAVGGVTLPPSAPSPIVVGNHLVVSLRTLEYGIELWSVQFIETPALAGDFNRDGVVDGADFLFWQRNFGAAANPYGAGADGDTSGRVGSGDLDVWKEGYGKPIPPVEAVAPVTTPPLMVVADVQHDLHPITAPLTATEGVIADRPDATNSWPAVAERSAHSAKRGRLSWFLDSPRGGGVAGRTAAFDVSARESAVFPAGEPASLWKSETAQAWDLLARESLVAGASGPGGVSSSLRPEKSSPFDGEEIDWRLEQLFQTERLAGTDSRDEL